MKWLSYPLFSCFVLWHFISHLLTQTDCERNYCRALESFSTFSLHFLNPYYKSYKSVRLAQDSRKIYKVTSEQSMHANCIQLKKEGKKTPQLLPKYAELTGMLYGALSEQTKRVQSASLSPVLPHPHIISRKIPDICCNFFLLVQAKL